MVTVVNRHKFKGKGEYVGRPSALGNPFKLKSAGGQFKRGETLECYREWLREQWKIGGKAKHELLRLVACAKAGDLNLVCSCKPHPCHGDVLKEAIEALINKGY